MVFICLLLTDQLNLKENSGFKSVMVLEFGKLSPWK